MRRFPILVLFGFGLLSLPAFAQELALDTPTPSSCSIPEKYESGVNMMIFVNSNENMFEAYDMSKKIAEDLSRLKDTGKVVGKAVPKDDDGKLLVFYDVYIEYQVLKTQAGIITGYAAVTHVDEVCSLWGGGKNSGQSIRLVETPGFLILSTKEELLRNVEDWVYDRVMKVVRERRQSGVAK